MGSLFIVNVPVRSYEFRLRLVENKLAALSAQCTSSERRKSLPPQNDSKVPAKPSATRSELMMTAKEIALPKTKEEMQKYTLTREDGEQFYLELTRDTMKVKEKVTGNRGSPSRGSLELESDLRQGSRTSLGETDIVEIVDSHFLEKHLEETLTKFGLLNASWEHSIDDKFSHVSFTVKAAQAEDIINHLHAMGIGKKYESTLSVCTATVFSCMEEPHSSEEENEEDKAEKERVKGKWNNFVQSIKARLTVAQVVQNVKANAVITFDYLVMVLVAGIIASLGLLEDSSVNLVASMLISPLMGPIMAFTFGAMIRDRSLIKTGVISELIGLSMCLVVGLLVGILVQAQPVQGPWAEVEEWPTSEMVGRSKYRSLVVGAGIAIPSGAGVALSILAGNAGSLVGVAISASLLPPCVNCGVFYGLALVIALDESFKGHSPWNIPCNETLPFGDQESEGHWRSHDVLYCENVLKEFTIMGTISLCLTLLNIALIFLTGIVVLKIKEVAPHTTKQSLERFWKQDLKTAREFNMKHGDNLLDDLDDSNVPNILNAVEDDFVFNQIRNRVMYRDENVIRNVKETKSKAALRSESTTGGGGLFGWFRSAPVSHGHSA